MIPLFLLSAVLLAAEDEESLSLLARTDLICPACQATFTTVVCPQSNTRAGPTALGSIGAGPPALGSIGAGIAVKR
jgi:hypothetical protein